MMANWFDFMVGVDLVNRVEGLIASFLYADWKGAIASNGPAGIATEILRTAVGANRHRFWVARDAGWSGDDIERFLRKYGVVIWDRGFIGDEYYFSVKERQANWAEYLLQRRGIPVFSHPFNARNAEYGQRYAPGDAPPAWADQGARSDGDRDFLDQLLL
jgi:hypothetical protein